MTKEKIPRPPAWRSGSRGAALVETLVLIPIFVLVFGALFFENEIYSGKLMTMRLVREHAWVNASSGCEGSSEAIVNRGPATLTELAGAESMPAIPLNILNKFTGSTAADVLGKLSSYAVAEETARVTATPVLDGSYDVHSTMRVQCNERVSEGTLFEASNYTFHRMTRW